jgi:hypothetical protein
MAAAAELHGDSRSDLSPELVLIDAALSEEARRLLVLPEDTLERLLGRKRGGSRLEDLEPLPELGEYREINDEVTHDQPLAEGSESDCAEPWPDSTQVLEITRLDQVEKACNSYPTLPSPPPEHHQKGASDSGLLSPNA